MAGALISLLSFGLVPTLSKSTANISIEITNETPVINEPFSVNLHLTASEAVNVFTGILLFDTAQLEIAAIDYNTSVADLWAEEPWYNNGEGTLTFTGGITRPGGFTGTEDIIRVTFKPKALGESIITMNNIRILKHDGLGTDAPVPSPLETIFTITSNTLPPEALNENLAVDSPRLLILPAKANIDLNQDGKQTIADTSIFMTQFATQNLRSDFNQDGVVNLKDLSIFNQADN